MPFLDPQSKEAFLREHSMLDGPPLSSEEVEWLATINFHHLMGYTRNFRALVGRGIVNYPKKLEVVRGVIEAESRLGEFMTPWLRRAEWYLRSLTVENYCELQGHGVGYLESNNWVEHSAGSSEKLQASIVNSVLRHGEPYVSERIKQKAKRLGVNRHRKFEWNAREECIAFVEDLPLWATIDSFSLGELGKFIMHCGIQPEGDDDVWRKISHKLGITARNFDASLAGFGAIRNQLFHHQRVWMKPMSKSPGINNTLNRRYRDFAFKGKNKQAPFIALAMVSSFLPAQEREEFLNGLEEVIQKNPLFQLGIMSAPSLKGEAPECVARRLSRQLHAFALQHLANGGEVRHVHFHVGGDDDGNLVLADEVREVIEVGGPTVGAPVDAAQGSKEVGSGADGFSDENALHD